VPEPKLLLTDKFVQPSGACMLILNPGGALIVEVTSTKPSALKDVVTAGPVAVIVLEVSQKSNPGID
jgi:hypothetical protein